MDGYKGYKGFLIGLIVLFVAIGGLFTFMFCNSFYFYSEFDLDYSDLTYDELTFDRFEKKRAYKSSTRYEIYFNEYEMPFEISTISNKKLDKEALKTLKEGEIIKVYYCNTSNRNYEYEICEFSSESTVILSLADYVETNQNNQIVGIIVCPILMLMSLFLIVLFARYIKAIDDEGLGKIKLEYIVGDNVIRVYNSLSTCSLVINDKVVDEYCGLIGYNFILDGKVKINGRKIPVEAKMGHINIRLYCDGKLVGKKFMGFG